MISDSEFSSVESDDFGHFINDLLEQKEARGAQLDSDQSDISVSTLSVFVGTHNRRNSHLQSPPKSTKVVTHLTVGPVASKKIIDSHSTVLLAPNSH